MRLFVYTSRLLSWLYSLYCLSYHVVKGVIANIPGTEIRIAGETALVKGVFFLFTGYLLHVLSNDAKPHILLMQKLFPIPTSDNQDICFGTRKNSKSGSGKKGYHFCWDEFSKLLEKRNPPTKSHASPTTIGIKKPSSDWRLQRPLALNLHQISSRMPFDDLSWQGFSTYFYGYTLVY